MKRVIIVHGFGGLPNGGWFPWLMKELAKEKVPAYSFPLPNTNNPKASEWIEAIHAQVGDDFEETILLGHSLGVAGILRYLEKYNNEKQFKGIVLVSGFIEKLEAKDENSVFRRIDDFVVPEIDMSSLKPRTNNWKVLHGSQDSIVPLACAEKIAKGLDIPLDVVERGDHFSQMTEPIYYELPEALNAIIKII